MNLFKELFYTNTKYRYMEVGFTEEEARAMTWIAEQKAKGKFVGAASGLFLAFTWGHWHHRILSYFNLHFSKRMTQLGIIMGSILISDYLFCSRRKGANQLFANVFLLNTNLLHANLDALIENFQVLGCKFSEDEIQSFQLRNRFIRTNHHKISNKKMIYNHHIHSPDEFELKIETIQTPPWIPIYQPTNLKNIIDETGQKLGVPQKFHFGWRQLH